MCVSHTTVYVFKAPLFKEGICTQSSLSKTIYWRYICSANFGIEDVCPVILPELEVAAEGWWGSVSCIATVAFSLPGTSTPAMAFCTASCVGKLKQETKLQFIA